MFSNKKNISLILAFFIAVMFISSCTEVTAPDDKNAPDTPLNFTLLGGGDGEAYFRWTSNKESDFYKYRLYRSESLTDTFRVIAELQQTEYVDLYLDYETTYYYYLTAIDYALNESDPTPIIDVIPLNISSPSPPTQLFVTGLNNPIRAELEMFVSWTPPNVSDINRFFIYRSETKEFTAVKDFLIDSTIISSYVDKNVSVQKRYFYKIVAIDRGGKRGPASESGTDIILGSPKLIQPSNTTKFSSPYNFVWQQVDSVFNYQVFVSKGPFSNVLWSSKKQTRTEVVYTGPKFESNSIYYWWVAAYSKDKITLIDGSKIDPEINSYSTIWSFYID